jgi:tetratricopeptide (TPR) repeat protein
MELLRQALEQAHSGHGQLVAVVGEPGLGKSRLFYEFTHSHRTQDWRILHSGSVSYGEATGYLPTIELLKAYFKITDRDSHRDIQAKVTGTLLTLDRALEPELSPILALLDVPTDDAEWTNLDPQHRRQRTLDAVKRLLLRESQVQPLLVVFEDLHWIDSETQALLDGLVESVPVARLLLLVDYRPEYSHGWASRTYYTQLRLDALPAETAGELLEDLLGADPSVDPLKPMLAARTGGNPLFLEESVRGLVEVGALAGERGAYRLTRAVEAIQVPATVQAILAARIDRLPPDEKALLEAASVIGNDVPFILLEEIADVRDDALRSCLGRLQAAEFLYEAALFPDLEYTFKHALTHDVAYSSLLQERRRTLHLKILEALEHRPAHRTTEDVERLARHAVGAESWGKAASYLRQAGRRASAQSAYRAAAGWFEEALRALQRLPESPDVLAQAIDVRLDLRIALIPLGRYHDALDLMREAEGLATRLGDRARLGWVLADICARLRNVLGEHHQAIEVGRRALAIATERGDRALELEAQYRTGQAYFAIGDYREAVELFSRNAKIAGERQNESHPFPLFASWSHTWLAMAFSNLGRFLDAMSHATEALRIAEGADHPFTLAEALAALGGVYLAQGELDRAIGALERGLSVVRKWKLQPWAALSRLGYAYALSERLPEALRLLEEVARSSMTMSSMGIGQSIQLAWLAEAYLLDRQVEVALGRAQHAMCLAHSHQERGHEAWIHRLLGEIASLRDASDGQVAEDHYGQALTLATELGMRPLVAHCHAGLGKLYRHTGKRHKGQEQLGTATTMYREMDMRFWLGQAEAEMKELGSQQGAPE